jgi:hypothetical protein
MCRHDLLGRHVSPCFTTEGKYGGVGNGDMIPWFVPYVQMPRQSHWRACDDGVACPQALWPRHCWNCMLTHVIYTQHGVWKLKCELHNMDIWMLERKLHDTVCLRYVRAACNGFWWLSTCSLPATCFVAGDMTCYNVTLLHMPWLSFAQHTTRSLSLSLSLSRVCVVLTCIQCLGKCTAARKCFLCVRS